MRAMFTGAPGAPPNRPPPVAARGPADLARGPQAAAAAAGRRARRRHRGGVRRPARGGAPAGASPTRRAWPPGAPPARVRPLHVRPPRPLATGGPRVAGARGRRAGHHAGGADAVAAGTGIVAAPDDLAAALDAHGARRRDRRRAGAALAHPARGARRRWPRPPCPRRAPAPRPAPPERDGPSTTWCSWWSSGTRAGGWPTGPPRSTRAGAWTLPRAVGGVGARGRGARGRRGAPWGPRGRGDCATGGRGCRRSSAPRGWGRCRCRWTPRATPETLASVIDDCEPAVIVGPRRLGGLPAPRCSGRTRSTPAPPAPVAAGPPRGPRRTSSTPRGRRAGRRARCTPTATCAPASRPTRARCSALGPGDRCHSMARLFTSLGFGNGFFRVLGQRRHGRAVGRPAHPARGAGHRRPRRRDRAHGGADLLVAARPLPGAPPRPGALGGGAGWRSPRATACRRRSPSACGR